MNKKEKYKKDLIILYIGFLGSLFTVLFSRIIEINLALAIIIFLLLIVLIIVYEIYKILKPKKKPELVIINTGIERERFIF